MPTVFYHLVFLFIRYLTYILQKRSTYRIIFPSWAFSPLFCFEILMQLSLFLANCSRPNHVTNLSLHDRHWRCVKIQVEWIKILVVDPEKQVRPKQRVVFKSPFLQYLRNACQSHWQTNGRTKPLIGMRRRFYNYTSKVRYEWTQYLLKLDLQKLVRSRPMKLKEKTLQQWLVVLNYTNTFGVGP